MNFKIALPLFLLLNSFFYAELQDHLKQAEGKSGSHSMRNVDFIYMINLDRRPEKFAQSSLYLNQYGIYPYRFSAVDGMELSLETINDVGLKYQPTMTPLFATSFPLEAEGKLSHGFTTEAGMTYFVHCMAKGPIAIALSHISILKDALDSGHETIWVMEDDIEVARDPRIISDLINRLDALIGKDNWDVLFTDQDYIGPDGNLLPAYGAQKRPDMDLSFEERYSEKYTVNKTISEDFRKISARFGAHSMIIRRSGMEKLLNFFLEKGIYLPYDLDNYLAPGLNRYALCYDVVVNALGSISDNK